MRANMMLVVVKSLPDIGCAHTDFSNPSRKTRNERKKNTKVFYWNLWLISEKRKLLNKQNILHPSLRWMAKEYGAQGNARGRQSRGRSASVFPWVANKLRQWNDSRAPGDTQDSQRCGQSASASKIRRVTECGRQGDVQGRQQVWAKRFGLPHTDCWCECASRDCWSYLNRSTPLVCHSTVLPVTCLRVELDDCPSNTLYVSRKFRLPCSQVLPNWFCHLFLFAGVKEFCLQVQKSFYYFENVGGWLVQITWWIVMTEKNEGPFGEKNCTEFQK